MSTLVTISVPAGSAVQIPVGPKGFLTLINNQATNKVYLGVTSSVSSSNGVQLLDSNTTVIQGWSGPLWAIATTGAQTIGVITS